MRRIGWVNKTWKSHLMKIAYCPFFWRTENMGRAKRIWYLSPMRAEKVQASLRIRAVSPEPPLLAHTSSEWRGTFNQKARFLVPLNGWACAIKICHDGMLEDTNSLVSAHIIRTKLLHNFNSIHHLHHRDTIVMQLSRYIVSLCLRVSCVSFSRYYGL